MNIREQIKEKSYLGFQKGYAAKLLRKELYPELSDQEVECISIILICHLRIEYKINNLLYKWMAKSIPLMSNDKANKNARDCLTKNINGENFAKKVKLIEPLAYALWDKDGKANIDDFYTINNIRNDIFHRMEIKKVKYKNYPICKEIGIEKFVDFVDSKELHISDLIEFIE